MTDAPVSFDNAYRGAPRGKQYHHWREEICRGLCNIEIVPSRDGLIDMHCRLTDLSPVVVASATGSSAWVGRSRETTGDGSDAFTFTFGAENSLPFHHHGKTDEIGTSDIMLGDLTEASGASLGECRRFMTLVIDRKTLINASAKAEDLMFRPLQIEPILNELINRYAIMAANAAPNLDPHARLLMGQHLVDLTSLALGAKPDDAELARQRGQAQVKLALIKADILSKLPSAELDIESVARRYGIGGRQAQRLFEQDGTTFTEFLLERRLLLVRQLLRDPANDGRKISDIAHSSGFSDLSYFNRVFRRRFGATPSDVRLNTQI
jgi:AraC-like DNA-binding protein